MSDDREHHSDAAQRDKQQPVEDLKPKSVDPAEAEAVKGGDIAVTKSADKGSANLLKS